MKNKYLNRGPFSLALGRTIPRTSPQLAGHQSALLLILALSVLLRLGVALYLGDQVDAPPLLTDQRSYHTLGTRLLAGQGFSFDRPWYPFTPAETPTAHWSFLYSLFVAGIYGLTGVHPLAVRLVGAVLGGVLLPWLVSRLARRLFPQRPGLALLAATTTACYAYFVLYASTLMTESLYLVVVVWSLERALALAGGQGARPASTRIQGAVLGLSLGLAILLRQSIVPWIVVLCLWLLWVAWRAGTWQSMVPSLLVAGLVIAILILPFTIRNYVVYGDFLLLNSNAGYAMFSAQHPMHGTSFREFEAAPLPDGLLGRNEAHWDRELMRRGLEFVLAEPGRYLLLCLSRVRDYFEFWPSPDTTLLHNVGRTGSFGLFLPLLVTGVWLALWRARPARDQAWWLRFSTTPIALVLLFMLFYSLLHILTWAMPRYRLPVDAVAVPFAALALAELGGVLSRIRA